MTGNRVDGSELLENKLGVVSTYVLFMSGALLVIIRNVCNHNKVKGLQLSARTIALGRQQSLLCTYLFVLLT